MRDALNDFQNVADALHAFFLLICKELGIAKLVEKLAVHLHPKS